MKAIEFKNQTHKLAETQDQYITLPILQIPGKEGEVISCWKLSFKERIKLLFTGILWHNQFTFGNDPMPIRLSPYRKDAFLTEADKEYAEALEIIEGRKNESVEKSTK